MASTDPLNQIIDRSLNYGRHLIRRFLTTANHPPMNVILDVGAGWGDDLLIAREQNRHAKLHAIEVHPEYQEALKQKNIIVHSLNIERDMFPFADESVDVVIANQILEHVKELFWVFHETTRVLRVGGTLIIGVPNLASLHNRILLALGRQPTCIQNHTAHVRSYTKNDILKFLKICFPDGYTLKDYGGSNFYPFPPLLAKPLASMFPTMAWGIFLMVRKEKKYTKEFLTQPVSERLETNFYLGK